MSFHDDDISIEDGEMELRRGIGRYYDLRLVLGGLIFGSLFLIIDHRGFQLVGDMS